MMRYFDGNMLLKTVFMYAGRNELFALRAILLLDCFFYFNISLLLSSSSLYLLLVIITCLGGIPMLMKNTRPPARHTCAGLRLANPSLGTTLTV